MECCELLQCYSYLCINLIKEYIITTFKSDHLRLQKPILDVNSSNDKYRNSDQCLVCYNAKSEELIHPDCRHDFCRNCWIKHFDIQLSNGFVFIPYLLISVHITEQLIGVSNKIECMRPGNTILLEFSAKICIKFLHVIFK